MIRRPVAVLVSRFPLITETFILREIIELERRGQPVLLVPLIREKPDVVHEEARPWIARALYTPFFSLRIAMAMLRGLVRKPLVILRLLLWICSGALLHPATLFKSLMFVPKAMDLAERLEAEGIRHVHAHFATYPALVATIVSALSEITFSFTVHAHDIFVNRSLLREKIRKAKFIRSISQFNKRFLESLFPIESAGKIEVVHVGVAPRAAAAPAAATPAARTVLCVAALKPYKGVAFLVEACRILASEGVDFTCDIIGTGPLRAAIRRAIVKNALHDRIRMRDALPQNVVAEEIERADVFVLPSIVAADGQMEGIPVALMEAMAARRPVVASALSGIPELVENEVTGLLVDPANPRQLAAAIRRLLEDPALRDRLGERAAQKVADEFDLHTTVAELLAILDRHNEPPDPEVVSMLKPIDDGPLGVRNVRRSRDSIVCEVVRGDEIIVKKHLSREGESRPPAIRATDEARILTSLGESMNGFSVPRLLHVDPASATVVMSRASGVPLTQLIRNARHGGEEAMELLERASRSAGAWLERFQRFEQGDGRDAATHIAERALADARRAGATTAVRSRIERLHRALLENERVAAAHHGDFWPGNIFASGTHIEVIDFEGYGVSLRAHDIAYFLLHASLYFALRGDGRMERLRENFLHGYGRAIDERELELCRLASALQLAAKRDEPQPFALRVIRNRVLRRELSR